jgi:DNA-binding CsgD family transcriptional regulator
MRTLGSVDGDLLISLHEGLFEQPFWISFLEKLRVHTGASHAGIVFRPAEIDATVQVFAGHELPRHLLQIIHERFHSDPAQHRKMREGRVYGFDELIDPGQPVQRAILTEALAPAGMGFLRSVRVTEPAGTDAWLTIVGAADFPAAVGALISRLVPHLRIALRSLVALERERVRSSISSEAMGRLNFGWLTLDPRCRILDATPNIEPIFQRTTLIRRGRYDRLTFASATLEREVSALVKSFTTGETRPRGFNLGQDPWMDIFVAPAQGRQLPGSSAAAIVYISGDRRSRHDRCEQLVDLFGLLPSEARLAWAIAQGRTIAQAAEELGLTIETARNYSKKIYSKTGTGGRAELMRLIFTSVLSIV